MKATKKTEWIKALPNSLTIAGYDGKWRVITIIPEPHQDGSANLTTLRLTEQDCINLGILR